MTHIVTTAYRPKRPPRKRKAVAIAGPAIVRKRGRPTSRPPTAALFPITVMENAPPPDNDDRRPAIVTTTSRKRVRLMRAAQVCTAEPDPEADAAMRAWLEREKWGRGPAR